MRLSHDTPAGFEVPAIRRITADRPLQWLAAGWRDLKANPLPALAYGLLFALGGDLIILAALDSPHLITAAISGFFLVAPLLAAGLYELSRRNAHGERPLFIESLRVFRDNPQSLAQFGLLLAFISLFWERLTAISFALIGPSGSTGAYIYDIILSGEHSAFLLLWLALGAMLALVVFALAVISVPMMVDRKCDVATAMMSSLRAFGLNTGPLLLWAAIIVSLTLLGFATLLFGLVVLMPIIGHASWHAYRELVE
jgi:uncharacterized membrane protein